MLVASWSSLEMAKLAVAAATPIMVALIGVNVSRTARRVEALQWASRKLIERRLALYDQMAGPLNDLFCFFHRVGNFREIAPPAAVERKRELDKAFHVNEFLMGPEFARCYGAFIDACFKTYGGAGRHAKLRSSVEPQRTDRGPSWDPAWADSFVADRDDVTDVAVIGARYRELMTAFALLLGVGPAASQRAGEAVAP